MRKVKITCICLATFEIRSSAIKDREIICPSCGKPLPDNASASLMSALKSLTDFEFSMNALSYRYKYSKD